MIDTMDPEPEVMAQPGQVRSLIARFSHMVAAPVANGSEPSLVSRNGHRSETASKRTLISEENDPSQTHSSSDISHRSGSQPALLDDMPVNESNEAFDSSMDTTPKTPSYMKISCSLSGYNRYNTYTSPKQEAKLKVLKLADQNGSHSSLSSESQSECSEVRGHETRPELRGQTEPITNGVSSECVQNGCQSNGALTNGRTELIDDQDRFVTKATVKLEPAGSPAGCPAGWTPELKLPIEDKRKAELKSNVSTPSPSKDGHYYFPGLDREITRLTVLCAQSEGDLQKPLSEEVCGRLRACVGKANLLMTQKFQQFRGLCEHNLNQTSDDQFPTTVQDLAGFWDMVLLQISDIDDMFLEIDKMRKNGWKIDIKSPVKSIKSAQKQKSPRSKETSTAPKSTKSSEAAKARDEARKRLMAAKRAGRQRKASQSDKDEIEIFVAE